MVNIDIELCTKSIRDNNYLMAEDSYINSLKEKIMYFLRWDDLALKEKEFAKGLIDNTHDINELISGYTNWLINNRFEDSFIACYTNRVLYSFVNDMKNDLWFFHGCFKIFAWKKN